MTSAGSTAISSRLLVGFCCFITLISVVFYGVGLMRLAWELRAQNERILALEENQQTTTTVPPFFESSHTSKFDCLFLTTKFILIRLYLNSQDSGQITEYIPKITTRN